MRLIRVDVVGAVCGLVCFVWCQCAVLYCFVSFRCVSVRFGSVWFGSVRLFRFVVFVVCLLVFSVLFAYV